MFISQKCPRCGRNLRRSPIDGTVNCFFCEGYSFREAHNQHLQANNRSPLSAFAFEEDEYVGDSILALFDVYPCSRLPVDEIAKMDFDEIVQGTPWKWSYGNWRNLRIYWRNRKFWMARRPWKAMRRVVLDEYDSECFDCEDEDNKKIVHHLHHVFQCPEEEYEVDNLVPLCKECHDKRHNPSKFSEDSEL